jgi:hypothetical protein
LLLRLLRQKADRGLVKAALASLNSPLASEALIGLFAILVGAVMMRRKTPRPVELVVWVGFAAACVIAIRNAHHEQALALTGAAVWGASKIVGSILGLLGSSAVEWVRAGRFAIATWVVLLAGAGALSQALIVSRRQAAGWQPRTRLGEWLEMPRLAIPQPAAIEDAMPDEARRFTVRAPIAAATNLGWAALLLAWFAVRAIPDTARALALPRARLRRRATGTPRRLETQRTEITVAEPDAGRVTARRPRTAGAVRTRNVARKRDRRSRLAS